MLYSPARVPRPWNALGNHFLTSSGVIVGVWSESVLIDRCRSVIPGSPNIVFEVFHYKGLAMRLFALEGKVTTKLT